MDTISRQAAIDRIEEHIRFGDELYPLTETDRILNHAFEIAASCVYNLPSAEPSYAQSIGKCETCCYWGNRMILRDGSLGDCGNFEKNLSKDFYCAWWSQRERGEEQDG